MGTVRSRWVWGKSGSREGSKESPVRDDRDLD